MAKSVDITKFEIPLNQTVYNILDEDLISTTRNVGPLEGLERIIGHKEAKKQLKEALLDQTPDSHIFIYGPTGSGISYLISNTMDWLKENISRTYDDQVATYNFRKHTEVNALVMPSPQGSKFVSDSINMIEELKKKYRVHYNSLSRESKKDLREIALESFEEILKPLVNELKNNNYQFNDRLGVFPNTKNVEEDGYEFIVPEDIQFKKKEDEDEFYRIFEAFVRTPEIFEKLNKKAPDFFKVIERKHGINTKAASEKTKQIAVEEVQKLKEKYCYPGVHEYLDDLAEDIQENMIFFVMDYQPFAEGRVIVGKPPAHPLLKYEPVLFVNNASTKTIPIVEVEELTATAIYGCIVSDRDREFTSLPAHHLIKPGAAHIADRGYIVVDSAMIVDMEFMKEIFKTPLDPETLGKKKIKDRNPLYPSDIDTKHFNANAKMLVNIRPLFIKNSPDFFMELASQFDYKIILGGLEIVKDKKAELINPLTRLIAERVEEHNKFNNDNPIPHFNKSGIKVIIQEAMRVGGNDYLNADYKSLRKLVSDAGKIARVNKAKCTSKKHVVEAIVNKEKTIAPHLKIRDHMYKNEKIPISVTGKEIGQMNILGVSEQFDLRYGSANRIQAITYPSISKDLIFNIDKATDHCSMNFGKSFELAVQYLRGTYNELFQLVGGVVTPPQTYIYLDGDSAGAQFVYTLVSSISGLPINQGIAATGAIDLKGNILGVGGIKEKVESFYRLCKNIKLTGDQGVIIPKSNSAGLNLSDEVYQAVKNEKFHIYSHSHVNEGYQILMGRKPEDVNKTMQDKLKENLSKLKSLSDQLKTEA